MSKSREFPGLDSKADCRVCKTVLGVVYGPLALLLGTAAYLAGS